MDISVIVSVYNRYKHLYWCLKSLANQSFRNFEVIIADDGTEGINLKKLKEVISLFSTNMTIKHIWHPDNGFQKSLILNKAVKKSSGELLVFLDCDVVVNKEHIKRFLDFYRENKKKHNKLLITGDLIFLKKDISVKILNNRNLSIDDIMKMIKKDFGINEILYREFRYLKYFYYKLLKIKYAKAWGANFAVNREGFFSVNGFDNQFKNRGEDTDLMKRLVLNGTKRIGFNRQLKAYHLFHKMVIEPEETRKKIREKLKWKHYKKNPHLIVAEDGINNIN